MLRSYRLLGRGRFWLERWFVRGAPFQLLAVAVLILSISLVGGVLALGTWPGELSLNEAIWWAFLRLTDPGYLGDDQGALVRTISTVLTVLGYVIFLGALVAIMTQWLHQTMRRLEAGLTNYTGRGHIVILGWTSRTPVILHELLLSEGRVRRFLRRHGTRTLEMVVLAKEANADLARQLRERVGRLRSHRRVIFRSGDPLHQEHLKRVDVARAASIVLPSGDFMHQSPEMIDTETIKTLLSLERRPDELQSAPKPLVVAEIRDARNLTVARRAYRGPLELVAGDQMISRLIAQNVRHHGLSHIYNELLTHSTGNEVYVPEVPEAHGRSVRELAGAFPQAVLLGLVRPDGAHFKPMLNPGPEVRVEPRDRLALLARDYEHCQLQAAPPSPDPSISSGQELARPHAQNTRRVLILGWHSKAPTLISEFDSYAEERFEIHIASRMPVEQRQHAVAKFCGTLARVKLHHVQADYGALRELAALEPGRYDNIVMVASDWGDSAEEADARTITGRLLLDEVFEGEERQPELLMELTQAANAELLPERAGEVIISPQILSHMLAHVALRRELNVVFEELFTTGGAEVTFLEPSIYGLDGGPTRFEQLERTVAAHGHTLLGVCDGTGAPSLNPPKSQQLTLDATSSLVVLVTYG